MKKEKAKGIVLVVSVLVLTTLLVIGSYLVSSANSESKIAKAQSVATKNYYLAEAGINDMAWKIKNDQSAREAFLQGNLDNSHSISRNNIFGDSNASYQVSAKNTAPAEAWIISTSTYKIGSNYSQRVVKTYVTRATGSTSKWEFSTFAGGRGNQQNGNFRFNGAGIVMTSNGGRIHANQELKVQGAEIVINDGSVTSANVINEVAGGKITLNNSYKQVPTSTVEMLQIGFDSWKNRADQTYSRNQFRNLPNNTTLNGIIYVTGDAEITGKNFTINGVLVSEGKIKITLTGQTLAINNDLIKGGGLLAKDNIEITTSGGFVEINGLIYSSKKIQITSSGTNFVINGSVTGFDAEITASGGSIIVNYTPEKFESVIEPEYNPSSPLIKIDHWEEKY